jgi:peptidoglycan hydrolase-like protein with peptidoglycan-binding domain
MHENHPIRTIVIMLAGWLVTACTTAVTDKPAPAPIETRPACNCSQNQQAVVFATEAEIKEIQARLVLLGYTAGAIDGVVGDNTRNAIKAYQADHQLLTDGRPSTELLAHIKAAGNGAVPVRN